MVIAEDQMVPTVWQNISMFPILSWKHNESDSQNVCDFVLILDQTW